MTSRMNRATIFIAVVFTATTVRAGGLEYRAEKRSKPRPLQIHVLQVDLADKAHELAVAVGDDPDGDGPAEAQLMEPRDFVSRAHFVAAVNANAWGNLPASPKGESPVYRSGGACDMLGWVLSDGVQRSPADKSVWSFWLDEEGRGHVGNLKEAVPAHLAISGFSGLLRDGEILPRQKEGSPLHPRTALGLDAEGKRLTLVVVDGRQPGISEGMSEYELAGLMKELGCRDALNLDGGGSSVLIRNGRIINHPSESSGPRPVPVMIGVRPLDPADRGGNGIETAGPRNQ